MWGADDPDERKPMVWSDQRYEDETTHPFGRARRRDRVAPDTTLFRLYQELIALRKQHLRLFVDGSVSWLRTDDASGLLAYERVLGDQRAIAAFNVSDTAIELSLPAQGRYRLAFPAGGGAAEAAGSLEAMLPARVARVWILEPHGGASSTRPDSVVSVTAPPVTRPLTPE
jgi:hypothetical protein